MKKKKRHRQKNDDGRLRLSGEERRQLSHDQKAHDWLIRKHNLSKPDLVSRYRGFMKCSLDVALNDLEQYGARYNGGDRLAFQQNRFSLQRELISEQDLWIEENADDDFAFIAGYDSFGIPYGRTWEAAGIDPELPFAEKVRRYARQVRKESGEYPEFD